MAGILRSSILGTPLFNSRFEEFGPIYVPEVWAALAVLAIPPAAVESFETAIRALSVH